MIKVNLTNLALQHDEYIKMLTGNKQKEIRKEMIKFLKENFWTNSEEYSIILEFVNDFFCSLPLEEKENDM